MGNCSTAACEAHKEESQKGVKSNYQVHAKRTETPVCQLNMPSEKKNIVYMIKNA